MRRGLISLGLSLLVWLLYTWPLALHLNEAIPSSSHNIELGQMREMIQGDQLQLLYHFWLFGDMLRGETPWFHNLYEFNTGDDARRFYPSPYFVPFSAVYALLSTFGSRALAWNLTGFLSIWLTLWLTWWVVGRFVEDEGPALCAALLSITFTYRWILLLGGSPSGFAMMMVPLALGGAHRAIRDRSLAGGFFAGAGLLMHCVSDPHSFYFVALFFPVWCLLCTVDAETWRWSELRTYGTAIRVLLPVPLLVGVGLVLRSYFERFLEGDVFRTGRGMKEVAGFSPHVSGVFQWARTGIDNHIFLGIGVVLILAATLWLVVAPGRWAAVKGRRRWVLAMLLACIAGLLLMALGANGPWEGLPLRAARRWVPRYDMIRQPARILVLMPTLLAVSAGCLLGALGRGAFARRSRVLWLAAGALFILEGRTQIEATLCRLDTRQGAYEAVVRDSQALGAVPRALVVPLWPGDSDLAATYLHYASLVRLRMWNGYSPVVSTNYHRNAFRPMESVNQGWLMPEQIQRLRERGVFHLLVHEDLFPEKVSPFPVQVTLDAFLRHPSLTFLQRAGPVWAFRIEAPGAGEARGSGSEPLYLPTRWFEPELIPDREGEVWPDPAASRAAFLRMQHPGDGLTLPALRVAPQPGLAWFLRVRGDGTLRIAISSEDASVAELAHPVRAQTWTWIEWPLEWPAFGPMHLRTEVAQGTVDFDAFYLGSQEWAPPAAGETVVWPAHGFFHAGESDAASGAVRLVAAREVHGEVFYAKVPPLPVGSYEATLQFRAAAEGPTVLGEWRVEAAGSADAAPVVARDGSVGVRFRQEQELPLRLAFRYDRAADMELTEVRLHRKPEAAAENPGRTEP